MIAQAEEVATAVVTVAPSPAFYVALALYAAAALFYVSEYLEKPPRWMARAALGLLGAAFVAHGVDISWRGFEHVHPGTSVREALGFLSWVTVGGYLWWSRRFKLGVIGAFVAPSALVILALARLSPAGVAVADLGQLGRIHIALATLGVAIFALATAVSVLYLFEERSLKRKEFDSMMLRRGAALEPLDRLSHRLVTIGFPIFSGAIMLGVIWGAKRGDLLGRVEWWMAILTWLTFGALLVLRRVRGWRGRRAALFTLAGFSASLLVLAVYLVRRASGG